MSSRRSVNETTSTTNLAERVKDKSINTWPRDRYRRGDVRNVSGVRTRHRKCGNHGHLASVCKCDGSQGKKKKSTQKGKKKGDCKGKRSKSIKGTKAPEMCLCRGMEGHKNQRVSPQDVNVPDVEQGWSPECRVSHLVSPRSE